MDGLRPWKDFALVKISEFHYPHIVVGMSDNTIHSFCRSPAEALAPLFSELFSEMLNKSDCSEESMIDQFCKSDYQLIREFGEIRSFGFDNYVLNGRVMALNPNIEKFLEVCKTNGFIATF